MFRLVESSNPDDVTKWNVRAHYTQRLVLTAAVCRELGSATRADVLGARAREALGLLSWWMRTVYDLPEGRDVRYSHALDHPRLAEYASDLKHELEMGTRVCEALFMAYTADKDWELDSDIERIREELNAYRAEFAQ
ncbi:hypothetical protein A5707_01725 [Mycobacterium kyorinense]|uniref:Uncharacterized protein n=1 Tax=Mycobacterium kyorinense TaxID=487514 RepID=A0A1A2Z815_9MYCO|nr:hypothetical protein [Mycobacterium kyorinense]OBI45647.1 hypothetical protein A5707_01725 [Mycobacterium kyorinense]